MNNHPLKIAIATTTRADWGLLSPIAKALSKRDDAEVHIIAGNMHFADEFGQTWKEIVADGFEIAASVPTSGDTASIMAQSLTGCAEALQRLSPDCIIILGDRYEMLGMASAAVLTHTPIVHIAGGAISEGAFDDAFRHAISKLSTLHLTETEEYRQRVIQLGESPERVINTGAIGVYNLQSVELWSKEQLEESIGFKLGDKSLLVTLHPATLEKISPQEQMQNLLDALDSLPDYKILFTHPNNDTDAQPLIEMIERYRQARQQRVCVVPSLGRVRYLSALQYVSAVVGNSSSGLVEVPSAGIPTLDIGIRQQGRTAAKSVVHCGASVDEIVAGLQEVTSERIRTIAARKDNPYAKADTLQLMTDAIMAYPWRQNALKRFYDLPHKEAAKRCQQSSKSTTENTSNERLSTLFVIPARGGSKGIPGKNIKDFAGKPLICHSIDCARHFATDDDICLTTDSQEIISVAEDYGLKVPFIRPDELASDTAGTYEVLLHAVGFYEQMGRHYDRMVLLQPTSPLRTADDVKACLDLYTSDIDMVVSVKEASTNPYYNAYELDDEGFLCISKGDGLYTRRQDVPKVWEYNGAVYVINIESLKRCSLGQFRRRRMAEMPASRSVDLDTPLDWQIAEGIFKKVQG